MALIGSILALFKADSSEFTKHTGKVKHELDAVHKIAHTAAHALGLFGIALGAHALVHGALESAEAVIENSNALTGLSLKTGQTVENLSALQFAAKASHLDFDELTASIKKFTINLSEAATTGKGDAFGAFEKLHLDVRTLANDPEAFQKTIEALSEVENHTERVAAATQIFGAKAALNVIPLTENKEGLAELTAEAKKLGAILTTEEAAALNSAHESMVRFHAATEGLAKTMTVTLAPSIDMATDRMTEFVKVQNDIAETGPVGLTKLQERWVDLLTVVSPFDFVFQALGYTIELLAVRIEELGGRLLSLVPGMREAGNAIAESAGHMADEINSSFRDLLNRDSLATQYENKVRANRNGKPGLGGGDLDKTDKEKEEAKKKAEKEAKEAAEAQKKHDDSIVEFTKHLQEQVDTFGMTEGAILRYKMAHLGADATTRFALRSLTYELDALKEEEELTKEIVKDAEELANKRYKFLDDISTKQEKYNRLLEEQKDLAHTPEELDKLKKHLKNEVFGKEDFLQLPSGALAGTQEARKRILEYQYGHRGDTHAKATADNTKIIADESKEMKAFLANLDAKKNKDDVDLAIGSF